MTISARHARILKDLTQEQVAGRLGISLASYQRFERDIKKMRVGKLEQLAELLGVKPSELITPIDSTERLVEASER